jgi:hypothetical protein
LEVILLLPLLHQQPGIVVLRQVVGDVVLDWHCCSFYSFSWLMPSSCEYLIHLSSVVPASSCQFPFFLGGTQSIFLLA